jgi:hypothetical protein
MRVFQGSGEGIDFARDRNQMDVVGHEAEADQRYPIALASVVQQVEVYQTLGLRLQDVPPGIPALCYVMRNAFGYHPSESSHSVPFDLFARYIAAWCRISSSGLSDYKEDDPSGV